MALNIPMPQTSGQALMSGLNAGGNLFSRIMQPIIQREQLAEQGKYHQGTLAQQQAQMQQQQEHFLQELALRKQAEARMGANASIQRQVSNMNLQKLMRESDPAKQVAYIKQLLQASHGGQVQGQAPMQPFSGGGMPSPQGMDQPQVQAPSKETIQNGFDLSNLSPEDQMILGMSGIKIPKVTESPDQKRFADLESKIKLQNYKNEQEVERKRVENDLKNEQTRQKTIDSAKNDLPHLEATLTALKKMKKIAANNPDLFGHSGFMGFGAEGAAERFAKTTDNPNAGAWQTYGLNPIIDAEMKMSSRGNQLALKTSLANKANFSENQKVAQSKIDANIKQIEQRIKETKKIAGEKSSLGANGTKVINGVTYYPDGQGGWEHD